MRVFRGDALEQFANRHKCRKKIRTSGIFFGVFLILEVFFRRYVFEGIFGIFFGDIFLVDGMKDPS